MKKNQITKLIVCTIVFSLTGCAMFTPSRQRISVSTNMPGAEIIVNGENLGKVGTVQTKVKRNKQVDIVAYKKGYLPAHKTIGKHQNIQAIADAAVCGLGLIIWAIPWCISAFAMPGAWSLDETDVTLYLQKAESDN